LASYYIGTGLLKQQFERRVIMLKVNLVFIKNRRNALNIPMHEMALELGFKNASTYLKYENGTYSFKANQLPLLSEVLECEITDFFEQKVAKTAI
jgi:transcriptional regulator with XRE-family HTH domain